jgi:hypothetical protein
MIDTSWMRIDADLAKGLTQSRQEAKGEVGEGRMPAAGLAVRQYMDGFAEPDVSERQSLVVPSNRCNLASGCSEPRA